MSHVNKHSLQLKRMYGVSSVSDISITPNHPACGGARELHSETTVTWPCLAFFFRFDVNHISHDADLYRRDVSRLQRSNLTGAAGVVEG